MMEEHCQTVQARDSQLPSAAQRVQTFLHLAAIAQPEPRSTRGLFTASGHQDEFQLIKLI